MTKPIYTTLGNNIEDIANNLLRENEELKAKLQVSDLQRVKDVCNNNKFGCINCIFYANHLNPQDAECIFDLSSPSKWDVDYLKKVLNDGVA